LITLSLPGTAIVTGGGNGIGAAIARMLAQAGAKVAVVDKDLPAAQKIADEIGGLAFDCDVAEKALVDQTVSLIRKQMGSVRYLINNAGIVSAPGQPFTENSEDDWDRTFAVNVKSINNFSAALYEELIAHGDSRIVNVTSITGVIAAPFMPPYSVSKSAANGLTRVLARQFASHGVTVNAVCPGFVWSPLWKTLGTVMANASAGDQGSNAEDVFQNRIKQFVPMGRPQTPEDVASTVVFLCSDGARNITGQIIGVDGGITI